MILLQLPLLVPLFAAGLVDPADDDASAKALEEAPAPGTTAGLEARVAEMERRLAAAESRSADGDGWSIKGFPPLQIVSADGDFKFKFGGRLYADVMLQESDSPHSGPGSGMEFRSARLLTSGQMYGNVFYKANYDFAGDVDFKDVYLGIRGLGPVGSFRIGHFFEPFGLETTTSSKYTTFLERSLLNDTFGPSRNLGAQLSNSVCGERGTWAVGVFRPTGSSGIDSLGAGMWSGTGRVTWLPVDDPEDDQLVHVGVAGSLQSGSGGTFGLDSAPEAGMMGKSIAVSVPTEEGARMVGAEGAWIGGPFSVQGELQWASVDNSGSGGDPNSYGYYVEGSWWPTGDSRGYDRKTGLIVRPRIENVLGKDGSWGAHQLALRYSSVMLEDPAGPDQEMMNVTAGWNWYWNPHTRFMVNYVHSEADDGTVDGGADILLLRWQIDF